MLKSSFPRSALTAGFIALTAALTAQPAFGQGQAVTGVVLDSLRGGVLSSAILRLEPSNREAFTDSTGSYRFASVAAGSYLIRVLHPSLDTLGIAVVTPRFTVDSTTREINVAVPPHAGLVRQLCAPGQLARGPSAVVGFVRDLDTDRPVTDVRVSLLLVVSRDSLGFMRDTVVREARADASGRYRICGLPPRFEGDLAVDRGGKVLAGTQVQSAASGVIARAIGVSQAVQSADGILRGNARLRGTVVNRQGQPLANATVTILGAASFATTNAAGVFQLDSLPPGAQSVEARRIGYDVTVRPVSLMNGAQEEVRITMADAPVSLPGITATDRMTKDLTDVGYMRRKATNIGGYFYDGEAIQTAGTSFVESLRGKPMLRVEPADEWGRSYKVVDPRDPYGGCVNYFINGVRRNYADPTMVDVDVRPGDVVALEIYTSGNVAGEFVNTTGQGKCMTIVIWTVARIRK